MGASPPQHHLYSIHLKYVLLFMQLFQFRCCRHQGRLPTRGTCPCPPDRCMRRLCCPPAPHSAFASTLRLPWHCLVRRPCGAARICAHCHWCTLSLVHTVDTTRQTACCHACGKCCLSNTMQPGVVKYVDRGAIPPWGANYAAVPADARVPVEPLFAEDTVEYVGQPIGLVLATSQVPPTMLLSGESCAC